MNPVKEVVSVLCLPDGDEDVRVERAWSGDLLVAFAQNLLCHRLRQAADEVLICRCIDHYDVGAHMLPPKKDLDHPPLEAELRRRKIEAEKVRRVTMQ
jgi:hypothetical protein